MTRIPYTAYVPAGEANERVDTYDTNTKRSYCCRPEWYINAKRLHTHIHTPMPPTAFFFFFVHPSVILSR